MLFFKKSKAIVNLKTFRVTMNMKGSFTSYNHVHKSAYMFMCENKKENNPALNCQ